MLISDHKALLYEQSHELMDAILQHVLPAFEFSARALLILRAAHLRQFEARLQGCDLAPDVFKARGAYLHIDAEQALEQICVGGAVDSARFEALVTGALKQPLMSVQASPLTLIYGELVDLLCERGRHDEAVALERMWNDLAKKQSFMLLCGYASKSVGPDAPKDFLERICREHHCVERAGQNYDANSARDSYEFNATEAL